MNLFTQIEEIVPKLDGWCTVPKATALASAVTSLHPKVIVELGVYGGRSLIPMALACKYLGEGRCIGVDPYNASASIQGQPQEHAQFWGTQVDHIAIRDRFLRRMDELEVRGYVEVHQMTSDMFSPPHVIDLFHLDGNHGIQAVKDVNRYAPNVRLGGMVFLDDIGWSGGAVSQACQNLLAMGFIQLYHVKNSEEDWACFQRIK